MTDRIHALTVMLEEDVREDDIQELIRAIKCMRLVGDVQTHVTDISDAVSFMRVRRELGEKLWGVLYPKDE